MIEQTKKELEENEVKEVSIFDSKVTVLQGHNADVGQKNIYSTQTGLYLPMEPKLFNAGIWV